MVLPFSSVIVLVTYMRRGVDRQSGPLSTNLLMKEELTLTPNNSIHVKIYARLSMRIPTLATKLKPRTD